MRIFTDNAKIGVITIAGKLEFRREYYYCRTCGYSETPKDKYLEIEKLTHKITKNMMVEVAFYAQNQGSFKDANYLLKKAMNIEINEETIREVTEEIGKKVYEQDTKKAVETYENMQRIVALDEKDKKDNTLYIMTDGAAVNTRVEDENGSTWRENKTVMVFTEKDMIKRKNGDHIIIKKEYLPYIGTAEEFRKYVLDIAVRAGYGKIKNIVIIADGATWIRTMCNELFPDAVQILDLFHLKENIYNYAKHEFGNDEKQYTPWAEKIIYNIENDKIKEALDLIPENEKLPSGVVNIKNYINNNIDKINYKYYKEKGYFVGSGAMESANKTILQRRLKQAGMRWSVNGAQYLLSLRSKWESNLWHKVGELISA